MGSLNLSDSSKHFGWYTRTGKENAVWDILIQGNPLVKSMTLSMLVNCSLTSVMLCDWQGTSGTAEGQKVDLRGFFSNPDIQENHESNLDSDLTRCPWVFAQPSLSESSQKGNLQQGKCMFWEHACSGKFYTLKSLLHKLCGFYIFLEHIPF